MSETFNTPPFPIQEPKRKVSILLGIGIFLIPLIFSWFTLRAGYSTLSRVISFGWLILTLIFMFSTPSANTDNASNSNTAVESTVASEETNPVVENVPQVIQVSAKDLFRHYEANEVSADRHFKGQLLEVNGTVQSIESGISDGANINFSVGDEYGLDAVTAEGDQDFNNMAANLSKGQQLTLRCKGAGEVIGRPFLNECVVI